MTDVTVTCVHSPWSDTDDYVQYDCGHADLIGHDEANESLVGATTECERCQTHAARVAAGELDSPR